MDRMLYLAMNGASNVLKAQASVTNNLANASTKGFRADFSAFRAMPVFGEGHPDRHDCSVGIGPTGPGSTSDG